MKDWADELSDIVSYCFPSVKVKLFQYSITYLWNVLFETAQSFWSNYVISNLPFPINNLIGIVMESALPFHLGLSIVKMQYALIFHLSLLKHDYISQATILLHWCGKCDSWLVLDMHKNIFIIWLYCSPSK